MNLKDNFNKKEISKAFKICKDKLKNLNIGISLEKVSLDFSRKAQAFLQREKQSWAEFEYEEKLARMVDAWDRMNTRRVLAVGGSVVAIAMIAFTVYVATQPNAYLLELNGAQVGYVESEEMVSESAIQLQADLQESMGVDKVLIDESAIVCTATREKKMSLLTDEEIEALMLENDVCQLEAWQLCVNGEGIATVASKNQAEEILVGVQEHYKTKGAEIIGFSYKETVETKAAVVGVNGLMTTDQAVKYILTGSEEPQVYTVQDGDTLWDIAYANNMKPAQLAAANPDFQPDKLKIGQVLNLVAVKPYLTVVFTERLVANQAIPFGTTYEKSSAMTRGQTKVKSAGKNGSKEVVSEIVKENGKVIATKVLSETVLSEPVMQVAYQGTKPVVLVAGSGVLGNPLSSINPSQGGGMFGASRGGRRHAGVDLRAAKGTAIYAADGGTVTSVSNKGSYGKLIVVNHGGGLETRYAHCDTMQVSVGDKVSKGEKIGTVGRTGNATGHLLHFEVRVNGKAVNPLNYL